MPNQSKPILFLPIYSIHDDIANTPLIIDLQASDKASKCCPLYETEDDAQTFAQPMEEVSIVKHLNADSLLSLVDIIAGTTDAMHVAIGTKLTRLSPEASESQLTCGVMTLKEFVEVVLDLKGRVEKLGSN